MPQARRWAVERAFSWLVKRRRLRLDRDELRSSNAAWVRAAMVRLTTRRLAKT